MSKCVVSRFNGVYQNDDIPIYGEYKFYVKLVPNINPLNMFSESGVRAYIESDDGLHFTNQNGDNLGTKITLSGGTLYLSAGSGYVKTTGRYVLTNVGSFADYNESRFYCPCDLSQIELSSELAFFEINDLSKMASQTPYASAYDITGIDFSKYPSLAVIGTVKRKVVSTGFSQFHNTNLTHLNLFDSGIGWSGASALDNSILVFGDCIKLVNMNFAGDKIDGSDNVSAQVNALAAAMVTAGRTSGTLTINIDRSYTVTFNSSLPNGYSIS